MSTRLLTGSMDFFSREFHIEGIGWVPSAGQGDTELGGGDTQHLLGSLAELGLEWHH